MQGKVKEMEMLPNDAEGGVRNIERGRDRVIRTFEGENGDRAGDISTRPWLRFPKARRVAGG